MSFLNKLSRIIENTILRDASWHDIVQNRLPFFPPDQNGEPCLLDDIVWYRGVKHIVVAISHKGRIAIRHVNRHDGRGSFWVKSVLVSHRKDG